MGRGPKEGAVALIHVLNIQARHEAPNIWQLMENSRQIVRSESSICVQSWRQTGTKR